MSRKKKGEPQIFSTTDFFGNLVTLSENTWNAHIIAEHPEMAKLQAEIQSTLKSPAEVRVSTHYDTGVAFISDPGVGSHPEGIRVLVDYEDTNYEKGASAGKVTTTYPIDSIRYSSPRIGRTVFKKGGTK